MKGQKLMLYEKDNIIFKITHPGEVVYTVPNEGIQARENPDFPTEGMRGRDGKEIMSS